MISKAEFLLCVVKPMNNELVLVEGSPFCSWNDHQLYPIFQKLNREVVTAPMDYDVSYDFFDRRHDIDPATGHIVKRTFDPIEVLDTIESTMRVLKRYRHALPFKFYLRVHLGKRGNKLIRTDRLRLVKDGRELLLRAGFGSCIYHNAGGERYRRISGEAKIRCQMVWIKDRWVGSTDEDTLVEVRTQSYYKFYEPILARMRLTCIYAINRGYLVRAMTSQVGA